MRPDTWTARHAVRVRQHYFFPFAILGMTLLHSEPAAGRMAATPEPGCEARGSDSYL
jgi:hypothetical protein